QCVRRNVGDVGGRVDALQRDAAFRLVDGLFLRPAGERRVELVGLPRGLARADVLQRFLRKQLHAVFSPLHPSNRRAASDGSSFGSTTSCTSRVASAPLCRNFRWTMSLAVLRILFAAMRRLRSSSSPLSCRCFQWSAIALFCSAMRSPDTALTARTGA